MSAIYPTLTTLTPTPEMDPTVAPPISSIFIAILALLLILRRFLLPNFSDEEILMLPQGFFGDSLYFDAEPLSRTDKITIEAGLTCEQVLKFIKSRSKSREDDFLIKMAKDLSAESVKVLLDCQALNSQDTDTFDNFFHEFADWTALKSTYPNIYNYITTYFPMELSKMSTWALKSFPVEDLLSKLTDLQDETLLCKLSIKKLLNHLIETVSENFDYWKLFTEACFELLPSVERCLVMKFLALIPKNVEIPREDLLLLMVRCENFLLIQLDSLKFFDDPNYGGLDNDDKIHKFGRIESFLDYFTEAIKAIHSHQDNLRVPVSCKLREALKQVSIHNCNSSGNTFIHGRSNNSNLLIKSICTIRPHDPMANLFDPAKETKPIKDALLTIFTIEHLFQFPSQSSFAELIESFQVTSSFHILEVLRSFSSDIDEILQVSQSVQYTETEAFSAFPILEWLKKAFELDSPELLNFYLETYKNAIKLNLEKVKGLIAAVNFDSLKFYLNSESSLFKMILLQPKSFPMDRKEALIVDFVDSHERFELLTGAEVIGEGEEAGESASVKLTNNKKLREFMEEAFRFYLRNPNTLNHRRMVVRFREMKGQDTGGLSRHFLSVCLVLLAEEQFGFFHRSREGKLVPRTLLDANILGFLGMLHGQCLKLELKAPWMIDFNIDNLPIKLCDLITQIAEPDQTSDSLLVPTCHDLLMYVNEEYKLFQDRFDLSPLKLVKRADTNYFDSLRGLEATYWQAGFQAYKSNLLAGLDVSIVKGLGSDVALDAVWEMLRPLHSSEIGVEEFMACFRGPCEKIKSAIQAALQSDPSTLIPLTLKFITGSPEIPPGGLGYLELFLKSIPVQQWSDRRLPQASTCSKTLTWTINCRETVEELAERFLMAISESKGFELE